MIISPLFQQIENKHKNQLGFSTVLPAFVLFPAATSSVTESTLKTNTKTNSFERMKVQKVSHLDSHASLTLQWKASELAFA